MINASESTSTRPYFIRALYEWCNDNGFTPYVAVQVDDTVQVPREYVKNGEIVLNISFDATSALTIGNEYIEFKARFAGSAREIRVPVGRVMAVYARENGQGMAFPQTVPGAPAVNAAGPAGQAGASRAGPVRRRDDTPAAPSTRLREAGDRGGAKKVVHLVKGDGGGDSAESPGVGYDGTVEDGADAPDDTPPRPPAGPGKRPALKRVK
ncbi:MAG: ClpXP protease specificity-enhancing factor [Variovorax sp.]